MLYSNCLPLAPTLLAYDPARLFPVTAKLYFHQRSGRPVLEALDMNRITAVQASRYLDLRFEHFDKVRNDLRMEPMRPAASFDDGE